MEVLMDKIICLYEDGELFHEGSLDLFIQENDGFSSQELQDVMSLKTKQSCYVSSGQGYVLVERIK
jgi:hypothetical protein